MKKIFLLLAAAVMVLAACENPDIDTPKEKGNVRLMFYANNEDVTRAESNIASFFNKLNVMVFDTNGEKVFDKVKTQLITDEGFGQMDISLGEGTYTIVAVGHSSTISAAIKSTEMVQFTASNGEKLTDTFCYYGEIVVGEDPEQYDLAMNRVAAMVRFELTDTEWPQTFARIKFDYTGGSANFNPKTSFGCTKSTQSETREQGTLNRYSIYTFPYMAKEGNLKVTVSALDAAGNVLRQRSWDSVPVTRNRITTYRGHFFEEGDGEITQSAFGFTVNGDWDGEDVVEF